MIIYKTTNLVNNKFYIGKDTQNKPSYIGSGKILKNAIKKYGKHNFKKEILEYCQSYQELNDAEIKWIKELDAINKGYNITSGGTGGDTWENRHDRPHMDYDWLYNQYITLNKSSRRIAKELGSIKVSGIKRWVTKFNLKKTKDKIIECMLDGIKFNFNPDRVIERSIESRNNAAKTKGTITFLVYKDNEFIGEWCNKSLCAEQIGIDHRYILWCLRDNRPSYKGYTFRYK